MKKLLIVVVLFLLVSCASVKYNAVLYDNAIDWLNNDFVKENKIDDSGKEIFIVDEPNYSTIIKSNVEKLKIDFDKQMLILYSFYSLCVEKDYITNINFENDILTIEFDREYSYSSSGDSCTPYQRWFILIIEKINAKEIVFKGKSGA